MSDNARNAIQVRATQVSVTCTGSQVIIECCDGRAVLLTVCTPSAGVMSSLTPARPILYTVSQKHTNIIYFLYIYLCLCAHNIQYTSPTSDRSWTAKSQSDICSCPRPKLPNIYIFYYLFIYLLTKRYIQN